MKLSIRKHTKPTWPIPNPSQDWNAATCTSPKACSKCGVSTGSKLNHDWQDAACTSPKTCSRCGLTTGNKVNHSYIDATCDNPAMCRYCGRTSGTKLGHDYADATCTKPATCICCGTTTGSAKGHNWQPATYTKPETCSVCQITRGKALTSKYKAGDLIKFGAYEQDNNTKNGKEPIEWRILAVESDKILIVSEYGLDVQPYCTNDKRQLDFILWEQSTLRSWLNGEFYFSAFTNTERARIEETENENLPDQEYGIDGGNTTFDRVFLLSREEAIGYFKSNADRKLKLTKYASKKGGSAMWWIRSVSPMTWSGSVVLEDGDVPSVTYQLSHVKNICIRPALWLNIDS